MDVISTECLLRHVLNPISLYIEVLFLTDSEYCKTSLCNFVGFCADHLSGAYIEDLV